MVKFLEVFPQVTYIYEHTMTQQLYSAFLDKVKEVINDKKIPTEDLCRVFNILVKISPHSNFDDQKTYHEILGKLRHSLYDVPKDHYATMLANLIELQNPQLARKMSQIVMDHPLFPSGLGKEFQKKEDMIDIFWSLVQLRMNDPLPIESYEFLNELSLDNLDVEKIPRFIQLVTML